MNTILGALPEALRDNFVKQLKAGPPEEVTESKKGGAGGAGSG